MTGYGKSKKIFPYIVEIKSLNSRYIDVISRVHESLTDYENEIVALIKNKCKRGKIYINIVLNDNNEKSVSDNLNKGKLLKYIKRAKKIKEISGINEEINLNYLLKLQDIFDVDIKIGKKDLMNSVNEAIDDLLRYRLKEGTVIEKNILKILKNIDRDLKKIIRLSKTNIQKELRTLTKNVEKIISDCSLDKGRLYQEVAILLEKKDINEEISRLKGHMSLLNKYITDKNDSGKKINFLLQEINRELNTVGSKVEILKVRHTVVNLKNNIEKIREQIQNIL